MKNKLILTLCFGAQLSIGCDLNHKWFKNEPIKLTLENSKEEVIPAIIVYASQGKYEEIASMLSDCDLHVTDANGFNALFYAVAGGHLEVVKLLMNTGAFDVNTKDMHGRTAIFYAGSAAVAQELLNTKGIDLHITDNKGTTLLEYGVGTLRNELVSCLLLLKKVNINEKFHGKTILMKAVSSYNIDMVKILLNEGANPTIKSRYGYKFYSAKTLAKEISTISPEILEIINKSMVGISIATQGFIRKMQDPNEVNFDEKEMERIDIDFIDGKRNTVLMIAALNNRENVVKFLINAGADIFKRNAYGKTALHMAIEAKSLPIINLLVNHNNKLLPQIDFKNLGVEYQDAAKKFYSKNLINSQAKNGDSPLHIAVKLPQIDQITFDIINFLLTSGAKTDLRNSNFVDPIVIVGNRSRQLYNHMVNFEASLKANQNNANAAVSLGNLGMMQMSPFGPIFQMMQPAVGPANNQSANVAAPAPVAVAAANPAPAPVAAPAVENNSEAAIDEEEALKLAMQMSLAPNPAEGKQKEAKVKANEEASNGAKISDERKRQLATEIFAELEMESNLDSIKELIVQGADINQKDDAGSSILRRIISIENNADKILNLIRLILDSSNVTKETIADAHVLAVQLDKRGIVKMLAEKLNS